MIGLVFASNIHELRENESGDRHLRYVTNVIIHEDFEPNTMKDPLPKGPDIALLRIDKALPK